MELVTTDVEVFVPEKRIKLEHSYAYEDQIPFVEVKEEDPLKIYPEDLPPTVKTEAEEETIEIKTEPDSGGGDFHQTPDSSNLQVVHNAHNSLENNCYNNCLRSVNCEVVIANNTNDDMVPRHVFLELQRMYEKTMEDVKSLDKRIKAEEKRRKAAKPPRNGNNAKCMKLTNDIKKIKEQLTNTLVSEQKLKKIIDSRSQENAELKKSKLKLETQVKSLERTILERTAVVQDQKRQLTSKESVIKSLQSTLNQEVITAGMKRQESDLNLKELKRYIATKESAYKECESKCSLLTKRLASASLKANMHTTELEKLKLDMDIMDKSIIDSLKTQQSFKEQVAKLEQEVHQLRDNPVMTLKVQELQKALNAANSRVDEVQKTLLQERKLSQSLIKETAMLQQEKKRKSSEADERVLSLNNTLSLLRGSFNQKVHQCMLLKEESAKLKAELKLKEKEIRVKESEVLAKEEELKTKVCQYCGF